MSICFFKACVFAVHLEDLTYFSMARARNFNVYTSEDLQAFTGKLVDALIYIEHVAMPNAVDKVIKTDWDGAGRQGSNNT